MPAGISAELYFPNPIGESARHVTDGWRQGCNEIIHRAVRQNGADITRILARATVADDCERIESEISNHLAASITKERQSRVNLAVSENCRGNHSIARGMCQGYVISDSCLHRQHVINKIEIRIVGRADYCRIGHRGRKIRIAKSVAAVRKIIEL